MSGRRIGGILYLESIPMPDTEDGIDRCVTLNYMIGRCFAVYPERSEDLWCSLSLTRRRDKRAAPEIPRVLGSSLSRRSDGSLVLSAACPRRATSASQRSLALPG